MRRLFIFFFLIIIVLSLSCGQKKTVVDYFNLLPDSLKQGYVLNYENNKWWTMNPLLEDTIYPTVDKEKGFIEIVDDGTGGGTITTQVALYQKSDGTPLIGISITEMDGVNIYGRVHFMEYHNGKWEMVSDKVLPEITAKNFMKPNYNIPSNLENLCTYQYKMSPNDQTIEVDFLTLRLSNQCGAGDSLACDFLDNIANNTIILKWDKPNTKFIIANK